jgi:release factor glutamine methyltransferase
VLTVGEAVEQGSVLLRDGGVEPSRLTAEVLLAHACRQQRIWLYAHSDEPLTELAWIHYGRYLKERLDGKPTQYLTHTQEFYGRPFYVAPGVLIPRPETELVVEAALARGGEAMADIGCGSGAIAVTLALESKRRVLAVDLSDEALAITRRNAQGAQLQMLRSDLCSALRPRTLDLLVSNPPYIPLPEAAQLQREVRDWEPALALYGGDDGLQLYRRLVQQAEDVLRGGGWLVLELGYQAGEALLELTNSAAWEQREVAADLAGLPRVFTARRTA